MLLFSDLSYIGTSAPTTSGADSLARRNLFFLSLLSSNIYFL